MPAPRLDSGLWRRLRRVAVRPADLAAGSSAERAAIEQSGLFDAAWYLAHAPEASGRDPLDHYREVGWRQGRSPGPGFDSAWYLQRYNDVAAAGLEPLLHYVRHGRHEGREPQPPAPTLLDGFQSLGFNCEFGLVQRHFGSEPLGLFRFSTTPLRGLRALLSEAADPFADPSSLAVRVDDTGEYKTQLRPYDFLFHSDVGVALLDPAAAHAHELRRLRFLWRKFREDLEEGSRIFVFRSGNRMSRRSLEELATLLRRYGPNDLLWVTPAEPGRPVGTVVRLAPGLMHGAIDRLSVEPALCSFEVWRTLCREAARLRAERTAP
jgi:hypothetical protein